MKDLWLQQKLYTRLQSLWNYVGHFLEHKAHLKSFNILKNQICALYSSVPNLKCVNLVSNV